MATTTTAVSARTELEQKIIGLILAYPEILGDVVESGLNEEMFSIPHKAIMKRILDCFMDDVVPTPFVLSEGRRSSKAKLETQKYLNDLITLVKNNNENPHNISYYCNSLRDYGLRDRIVTWAEETVSLAREGTITGRELQDRLMSSLFHLDEETVERKAVRLRQGLIEYLNWLQVSADLPDDQLTGFRTPTGFRDIDRYLNGGFRKGTLNYIAARPGNCKTTMLLNMALNATMVCGIPAVVLSFEMELDELLLILLSMVSEKLFPDEGVPSSILENPKEITELDWIKLTRVIQTLNDIPLWIEDCDGFTTHQLEAKIARYAKMGVDSFYLDYWQLVRLPNGRSPREEADYNETSEALRRMAKKVHGKLIAAAQVNRESESRAIKQPTMKDIRSSGKAEMDAHRILTLHYPDAYPELANEYPNELHVAIVKNRRGRTGVIHLWHKKEFGLLEDIVSPEDTRPKNEDREDVKVAS